MYICNKCKIIFNQPSIDDFIEEFDDEIDWVCPECGSRNFDKLNEDEDD